MTAAVRPSSAGTRVLSPSVPAFWVVALLVGMGCWQIGMIGREAFSRYPTATAFAIVLFALYAVPFVLFVRGFDYLEREPAILLATAFVWGAAVATSQAIPANQAIHDLLAKVFSPWFADEWGAAIAGPTTEETLKAAGVVAIVLLARTHVNSIVDGFVYGALVGLGFQVVENVLYAVNAVALSADGDQAKPVLMTFLVRGFLGGLWSHTLFTALAGAGIAYAVLRRDQPVSTRAVVAGGAFVGAWSLHFIWNSPWLADGIGFGVFGVLAAVLLKGLPGLVAVLLLAHAARRHEAAFYTEYLNSLADPRLATVAEIDALVSNRRRELARKDARANAGVRAGMAVRRLQRAQARLAVELSRGRDLTSGPVRAAVRDILAARQRLLVLGHPEAAVPPARRG